MPGIARSVYRAFYRDGESRVGILRAIFFEISSLAPDAVEAAQDALRTVVGSFALYVMAHMQAGPLRPMHPGPALLSVVGPIMFHLLTRSPAEQMPGLPLVAGQAVTQLAE